MESIYRSEDCPDIEIRWNGGATFNIWIRGEVPHHHTENGWTNTDCFTRYGSSGPAEACTDTEARIAAEEHFEQMIEEAMA